MQRRSRAAAVCVAAVVVVGGVFAVRYLVLSRDRLLTLQGTITRLDSETRRVSIEFAHPRNGKHVEFAREVPPDCEIQINGQPAQLSDLRAGDTARVKAIWNKHTKQGKPLSVEVSRATGKEPGGAGAGSSAGLS